MRKMTRVDGIACPLFVPDIDTDQIAPREFLMGIEATGYGNALFHHRRFKPDGTENPDFPLNRPPWRAARILVAGRNFGCGSSREHAVWAIRDYGLEAIIAPSFGDIFRNNCSNSGVLATPLAEDVVRQLADRLQAEPDLPVSIDLERQEVGFDGLRHPFSIDSAVRHRLLNGLDRIEMTLQCEAAITDYEAGLPQWIVSRTFA